MSDLKFDCPHCEQPLEVPEDMFGLTVECPSCNGPIQLPIPKPPPKSQLTPTPNKKMITDHSRTSGKTKPCPFCGEYILQIAQKCKHCGEFLKEQGEVKTNVKQGALIGAVACFIIGTILMSVSLWSFFIYSPLFLAGFVLSIVAMSQKRVAGGLCMLLLTLIVPPLLFFWLGAVRGTKALDEFSKTLDEASVKINTPLVEVNEVSKTGGMDSVEIDSPLSVSTSDVLPSPVEEPVGWKIQTDISPIDDSKSYFLRRDANEPIRSRYNERTPTLIIRHKEGKFEVYITFGTYLGSDSTTVTCRMGSAPAQQDDWGISTDGKAIFCPIAASTFVKQLLENDKLVVRLTPFGESPITSTFDLTGLSEAIQPMSSFLR